MTTSDHDHVGVDASALQDDAHDGHSHEAGGHQHAPANFGKAFAIGIALNLAYVFGEAFYGVASHSLALLADAGHNFGDVLGLAGVRRAAASPTACAARRSSLLSATPSFF